MSNPSGITSWVYDARGRVVQESKYVEGTGGGTFVTQWGYDSADRMTQMVYPGGEGVNFLYNEQGLLRRMYTTGVDYVQSAMYDAAGRVTAVMGSSTTVYIGAYYEKTTSGGSTTITKYYQAGGQRVAMRVNGVLRWLASDHLGSTALTISESGARMSEIRYKPWGESRYTFGATPTQRRFTGQVLDEVAGGLYFYNARYYDPALGRFAQADTIVPDPGNPQSLNRHSYALGNPLRFSDPTGHFTADEICTYFVNCGADKDQWKQVAQTALGSLFDLLWETPITWGDVLFMGNDQGVTSAAMFVLMTNSSDGSSGYYARLWGLSGQDSGMPIDWRSAQRATTLAAHNVQGNSWEGMTRRQAEAWVGKIWMQALPAINGVWSLHKTPASANYHFSTYMDYNGWWWAASGVTVTSWFLSWPAILTFSALGVDVAGLVSDLVGIDFGPIDDSYAAIYYDPVMTRAPWQLHRQPPKGIRP